MARKRGKKKATGSIAAARRIAQVDSSAKTSEKDDASNQPSGQGAPASTQTAVNQPIEHAEIAEIADNDSDDAHLISIKAESPEPVSINTSTKTEPAASPDIEEAIAAETQPAREAIVEKTESDAETKTDSQSSFLNVVEEELKRQTAAKTKRQSTTKNKMQAAAKPSAKQTPAKTAVEPAAVEPELKAAVEPESKPAIQPESKPAAEPESKAAAGPEFKPEEEPESKPAIEPEPKPAAEPEPKTEAEPEPWRWSKPADYFAVSAVAGQMTEETPYQPVDYLSACGARETAAAISHAPAAPEPDKTNIAPAVIQPNPDQFWPSYESAAAARIQPDNQHKLPTTFPHPNHIPTSDVFLTFEEASKTAYPPVGSKPNPPAGPTNANPPATNHDYGAAAKSQDAKNKIPDDEGWIPADSKANRPKLPEPTNFASPPDQVVVESPSLAEQVMKLAASTEQTNMPVEEASDSGTNLTESSTSNDSSDSWQPISKLVDPREIKAAPPVSERSKEFIDNLRQSITKSGARELTSPEKDIEKRKLSGSWRRSGEPHNDGDSDDDDAEEVDDDLAVLQPPPGRPLLPPAPLRKQTTGEQKITLEDRAIAENVLPADFNEHQLSVKRLRDRTTSGKYHVYLAIYAICIVLGFATQRVASPDVLQVTKDAGQAVTGSVSHIMLPNAIAGFSNGLKIYEEETTRQMAARKQPVNFFAQIAAGCDAAGKTASQDVGTAPVKQRRYWYSLPTGFVLGWPVAALYTVRDIFGTVSSNKSGFELLLISFMCVAILADSAILYMKLTNRLAAAPKFAAPVIVLALMSIVTIPIWAVLTFSLSICKVPMPDTIEVFTALAIIIVSGVSAKFSFVAPKKRQVDPRLM